MKALKAMAAVLAGLLVPAGEALAAVAMTSDGKIVVARAFPYDDSPSGDPRGSLIARVLADGSPDRSFGRNGQVTLHGLTEGGVKSPFRSYGLALTRDDRIVFAGLFDPSFVDAVVVRLKRDGSFDRSFGNGDGTAHIGDRFSVLGQLTVQKDGKVSFPGSTTSTQGQVWSFGSTEMVPGTGASAQEAWHPAART